MKLPVTYLIPVYGKPLYWRKCLESVASEPVEEIVIVANGLDDNFSLKIRKYIEFDNRFKYFERSEANLVKALNFGVTVSSHNLIARLDIDDVNIVGRTELQFDAMNADPELLVLGGQVLRFRQNVLKSKMSNYPSGAKSVQKALKISCVVAHPTVLMKREEVLKIGGYREFFRHGEDYDLWLRLNEIGKIDNLSVPLIYYREHDNQVSRKFYDEQEYAAQAAIFASKKRKMGVTDLPLTHEEVSKIRSRVSSHRFSTNSSLRREKKRFAFFLFSFCVSPWSFLTFTLRYLKNLRLTSRNYKKI